MQNSLTPKSQPTKVKPITVHNAVFRVILWFLHWLCNGDTSFAPRHHHIIVVFRAGDGHISLKGRSCPNIRQLPLTVMYITALRRCGQEGPTDGYWTWRKLLLGLHYGVVTNCLFYTRRGYFHRIGHKLRKYKYSETLKLPHDTCGSVSLACLWYGYIVAGSKL